MNAEQIGILPAFSPDNGVTIRMWLVGQALAGIMARAKLNIGPPQQVADEALSYADAVLEKFAVEEV